MRRKIMLLSLVILCVSAAAAGSFAYFTEEGKTENVITAGNIRIALDSDGGGVAVVPGTSQPVTARIRNVGDYPAFVRLGMKTTLTPEEPGENPVSLTADGSHWEWKDGYYYYKEILNPGDATEPLKASVHFSSTMGNCYENGNARVKLLAYAVQTDNNGKDPMTAAGWPEEK